MTIGSASGSDSSNKSYSSLSRTTPLPSHAWRVGLVETLVVNRLNVHHCNFCELCLFPHNINWYRVGTLIVDFKDCNGSGSASGSSMSIDSVSGSQSGLTPRSHASKASSSNALLSRLETSQKLLCQSTHQLAEFLRLFIRLTILRDFILPSLSLSLSLLLDEPDSEHCSPHGPAVSPGA